jgi:hypothetical protein
MFFPGHAAVGDVCVRRLHTTKCELINGGEVFSKSHLHTEIEQAQFQLILMHHTYALAEAASVEINITYRKRIGIYSDTNPAHSIKASDRFVPRE